MKLALCSFLLLSSIVLSQSLNCGQPDDVSPTLLSGPESQNATDGSKVVFSCRGIGQNILWYINGARVDQNNMAQLQITRIHQTSGADCNVNSTMLITAGTMNNDSVIYCSVLVGPITSTNSNVTYLRVQGPPTGLHGLQVTHLKQGDSHHVEWSPPVTLQGIQTLYNVSVIDVNNGSQVHTVDALSRTSIEIRLAPCHGYIFTIIPYNGAGNGDPVELQYTYPGAPIAPMVESIGITSLALNTNSGLVIATLQYMATSVCYDNQNITVKARVLDDQLFLASPSQVVDDVVTVVIDDIPLNKVLSVDLVLTNQFGNASIDGGIMIKTYNTQSVVITTNQSATCFKCVFLTNSMSSGCLLVLNPVTSSEQGSTCSTRAVSQNITLPQTNCSTAEKCFDNFTNGSYNIDIYDIFNNSNDTEHPNTTVPPQVLRSIDIKGQVQPCSDKTGNSGVSRLVPTTSDDVRNTLTVVRTPVLTPGSIENNSDTMRIAGLLIGVVCGVLIIIIIVIIIIGIFIYRKQRIKEGSMTINQNSTDTKGASGVDNGIPTGTSNEQHDQGAAAQVVLSTSHAISSLSFSSLGPPPYQPPPSISSNFDHYPTEQYIIMHSASPRSPTASNSTSSHLALIQGCGSSSNNSSHRDLSTSGHYDHLVQVDREDVTKKHCWSEKGITLKPSAGHYHHANSNGTAGDQYSFELKPYTRNEHLV